MEKKSKNLITKSRENSKKPVFRHISSIFPAFSAENEFFLSHFGHCHFASLSGRNYFKLAYHRLFSLSQGNYPILYSLIIRKSTKMSITEGISIVASCYFSNLSSCIERTFSNKNFIPSNSLKKVTNDPTNIILKRR